MNFPQKIKNWKLSSKSIFINLFFNQACFETLELECNEVENAI